MSRAPVRRFAASTSVPVERSRAEIERTLDRYGCEQTGVMKDAGRVLVLFRYQGVVCQIEVPRSKDRNESVAAKQDRQAMRILLLLLKAKLEAVEAGIAQFDVEFMGSRLLPNGQRMGDWIRPHLEGGAMPKALPALGESGL